MDRDRSNELTFTLLLSAAFAIMIPWPFATYLAVIFGSMGSMALLSELTQKALPAWLAVGLVSLPAWLFVIAEREDGPSRLTAPLQAGAGVCYLLSNVVLAVWAMIGNLKGAWFFLIFVGIGAIPYLAAIRRAIVPARPAEDSQNEAVVVLISGRAEELAAAQLHFYRHSAWEPLLGLLIDGLLCAVGLFIIVDGKAFGWFFALLFGAGAVFEASMLREQLSAPRFLTVSSKGVAIFTCWRSYRYRWGDIAHFYTKPVGEQESVVIVFRRSSSGMCMRGSIQNEPQAREAALPDSYGFAAAELAAILNQWKAKSE